MPRKRKIIREVLDVLWTDGLDDDDSENISVYDAADAWASSGFDEDYTFGYSEDELRDALNK